jgi:hypothetical protein
MSGRQVKDFRSLDARSVTVSQDFRSRLIPVVDVYNIVDS